VPRHHARRGCDPPIVTCGPLTFVSGSLHAWRPQTIERLARVVQASRGRQRLRQSGRFQRVQDPLRHEGLARLPRAIGARLPPILEHRPAPTIALPRVGASIASRPTVVARATADEASQQRRAMTPRAQGLGMGAVGGEADKSRFVRLPGARGRHRLVEPPLRRMRRPRSTTAAGAARPLVTPIDLAAAIGVGPGREGVSQARWSGRTLGTAPLQPPCGRAGASAYPQRDALRPARTPQGRPRAQVVNRPNDQAPHVWHGLLGLQGHGTGMVPDIAARSGNAPLASASGLPFPLLHALCEPRSCGLTHRALKSPPQPIRIVTRIRETVHVREQGAQQRPGRQPLMPVFGGARHTCHLHADHPPAMIPAHVCHTALPPVTALCRGP
jgi:hypothetical protein